MENILKDYLQPLAIIIGAGFTYYQYTKQQRFKRIQNLSSLWKNFSSDSEIFDVFTLMNDIESGKDGVNTLQNFSPKIKLKYLALIEEVTLYVNETEVDKELARYLFQWHFYFVYQSPLTTTAFWENIGEAEEMNASYWAKSRNLSMFIKP